MSTEDVREELAAIVKRTSQAFGGPALAEFANDPPLRKHYATADAIRTACEVRPRGTVTFSEAKKRSYAVDDLEDGADFQDAIDSESIRCVVGFVRTVLEAAREARS